MLFFVLYIAVFFIVEPNTPTEGYWVTDSAIDAYIPFIPQFVYAYVLWYPLFAVVGLPLLIKDGDAFRRWMYFLMITLSATMLFDVLIPNGQHLRPTGVEVTSVSTWILNIIWWIDTPTNVFPSMHVLGCIADISAVCDSRVFSKKWRIIIIICCVLCSASTVLVKQHAYIDTVGALLFAAPVFFLIYRKRFFAKKKETL
ncbi:MAG: hypothetical protein RR314_05355 [Oscillospiraceae bacterium]